MSGPITIDAAKSQAKLLRSRLLSEGVKITHASALEMVAAQNGARDWNTLHARLASKPNQTDFQIGQRVTGEYLGHAFHGLLVSVSSIGSTHKRVTIRFDDAVDVVSFSSFSNMRKQINAVIDQSGVSPRSTSDGRPQLVVRPA